MPESGSALTDIGVIIVVNAKAPAKISDVIFDFFIIEYPPFFKIFVSLFVLHILDRPMSGNVSKKIKNFSWKVYLTFFEGGGITEAWKAYFT